ncbi:MAG: alpha/beta hydrolase [Oscillospiraceae bacterium]|nr:alpha/beta hydrolase [Oscillospiraceae bacterium]
MQFHEFGEEGNPTLLVMHSMLCDWQKFREIFMPLERDFHVIYPALNGCYNGAPNFNSFANECAEIEKYIMDNYNGNLDVVIGVSQGATLMSILASRGAVAIKKSIQDGVYVAHQGKLSHWACALLLVWLFSMFSKPFRGRSISLCGSGLRWAPRSLPR